MSKKSLVLSGKNALKGQICVGTWKAGWKINASFTKQQLIMQLMTEIAY